MTDGKNGKISDHIVIYTSLNDVQVAANFEYTNSGHLTTDEIRVRRLRGSKKRYTDCGIIRDLNHEQKVLMAVYPLHLYTLGFYTAFHVKSFCLQDTGEYIIEWYKSSELAVKLRYQKVLMRCYQN